MRVRAAAGAAVIAAAAVLSAEVPQQPTFRSGTAAVVVDVNVRDRAGRPVTRLGLGDFELFDNDVRQKLDDLSYGKVPIDVTVALDVSYSVTGSTLNQLRRAVTQLMHDLEEDDRLKLVMFNMRIDRTIDFTRDTRAVEAALRSAAAGGGTALMDTLSVSLVSAAAPDRRQLVVAFTDGADSSSTTTPDVLTRVVERTRATLAFVMPAGAGPMISRPPGVGSALPAVTATAVRIPRSPLLNVLTQLARDTGGSVFPVGGGTDLTATFRQVLSDFRSTYVLYYRPQGVERAGYHAISVKVKRENVTVRARRGYVAR